MPVRSLRIFAIVAAASVTLFVGCAKKTQVAKTVPPPASTISANGHSRRKPRHGRAWRSCQAHVGYG